MGPVGFPRNDRLILRNNLLQEEDDFSPDPLEQAEIDYADHQEKALAAAKAILDEERAAAKASRAARGASRTSPRGASRTSPRGAGKSGLASPRDSRQRKRSSPVE